MTKVLYVWKGKYPWDIRAEKICNSLYRHGWDVYLLARWTTGQAERENYKGINIIRAGYNKNYKLTQPVSFNPIWKKAIKQAVDEIKPDIIIPRDIMLAEACGKIGRSKNIPVLMDMAEHYPAAMKGWKKYYQNIILRILVHHLNVPELVEKRAVKLMSGIILVSDELLIRLNEKYNYSIGQMMVVHNTPEKDWFKDIKLEPSYPPTNFAYHGYFSQDRNLDILIKGFIIAAQKNKRIRLILSGNGENYKECCNIARSSNVSDRIILTGEYKHNEIKVLYENTDIAILPFKNNEFINHILANKLFDYMAVGRPVIVSTATPMARIINETQAGLVIDCNDPENIANVILNINQYPLKQMSDNGIKIFREKYNWDVDSDNMLKFVERFI